MADQSKIEWTDATWNPVTGCTKVSPGCDHCYAETFAERWRGTPGHHFEAGFDVTLRPERLDQPLRWKKPRRIFVNSMSDLFHDDVPDEYIARVFAVMAQASHHTFQILTKRHARMRSFLNDICKCGSGHAPGIHLRSAMSWAGTAHSPTYVPGVDGHTVYFDRPWPLPNVWLGVSVENQQWAEARIPALLETPAAVRFISAEPLLGPVDLRNLKARNGALIDCLSGDVKDGDGTVYTGAPSVLDWVIVGGESGRGARPMHPRWPIDLRDQCLEFGHVSFHFKQWGEWRPQPRYSTDDRHHVVMLNGMDRGTPWPGWGLDQPDAEVMERVGKKAAGRVLEGRTWDEFPQEVLVRG
ncbi:hypothetical protein DMB42_11745 [Nonomuraea sp. WAC 01424]|uniref:DUF5131 family protein n=1 Tax=Nonomuraea sp. WAC 01424 TaxID=2203200 RepID=UPI000F7AC4D1|nr:phage Gp37/Gp68 family protein [Nonomuraea sp. WAC 01424]RSN12844.1 hypothetical protein DMB42_11745 [Nonomuraea sp. WAC 01424]